MQKKILIVALVIIGIIVGGGVLTVLLNLDAQPEQPIRIPLPTGLVTDHPAEIATENDHANSGTFTGNKIAGNTVAYIEFNQADYDAALSKGYIILLNFYADWCPICKAEAPRLHAGFDQLTVDNVVAFRVNYKDDQTDENEKQLAKQFNIPYQHTKVILKNGREIMRDENAWDTETLISKINSVAD